MQFENSLLKYGYNRQNRVSSMLIRLPISESQKSVCVVPLCLLPLRMRMRIHQNGWLSVDDSINNSERFYLILVLFLFLFVCA
jgi:hypothetical protein